MTRAALALLLLGRLEGGRVWKSSDWGVLNRLLGGVQAGALIEGVAAEEILVFQEERGTDERKEAVFPGRPG